MDNEEIILYQIPEISRAFDVLWSEVSNLMIRIGNQGAFAKPHKEVWSISEEFDHMILSSAPIAKVLNLGFEKFKNQGLPERKSMVYSELSEFYWNMLNTTVVSAPSRYTADESGNSNLDERSVKWFTIGKGLVDGLNLWDEAMIDNVQLKHPLLGFLTLREMLFFTHIHTSHHFRSIQKKASILSQLN
jgi:hypothetical protein